MQVLLYVISMLMLIGVITYTRVESFQDSALLRLAYQEHMRLTERAKLQKKMRALYDALKETPKKENIPHGDLPPPPTKLNPNLNIEGFIVREKRESDLFPIVKEIFIQLVANVYGNETFYREYIQEAFIEKGLGERQVIEGMIEIVMKEAEVMEAEGKIKKSNRLLKVEFGDLELRNLFVKMLNGKVGNKGYPPLSDFAKAEAGEMKVSVYLAKRPLLLSIFRDPFLVNEIIAKRNELYRQYINKEIDKGTGEMQLRNVAGSGGFIEFEEQLLNYSISSTRPPQD